MILPLLLALVPDAAAIDLTYWGVGPSVGTMLFPAEYPFSFPAGAKTGGVVKGDPLVDSVGFDMSVEARGVIYPSTKGRVGARVGLTFGSSQFFRQEFTLEYEPTIIRAKGFQVLAGGGIGVGHERFNNADTDAYLDVSYYPLRAQISGLLRDRSRAYELSIYGTYHIAGSQKFYANADAEPIDGIGKEKVAGLAAYGGIGLEATVFFGDFKNKQK